LLPTGGGKSICYQLPALMLDGLCLVVSPLIALMKDQVQQLHDRGIKAACIFSGTNSIEQEIIYSNCIHGKIKILYVSPERLGQRPFIEHFRQMKVSFLAVDEAHCISQWGYDFRPSYLEIAKIRTYHPSIPILALTATATPAVADDIQRQLMFSSTSQRFQSSFQRPNLAYMVFREEEKMGRLLRIARNVGGSGIVYVRNRRRTREIADQLVANGITATYYHAGLDPKARDIAQGRWMKREVNVIVATNAFGMGIDKPDVRYVVHMDIPSSTEAYFQEAGRAGRDGNKSFAVLLYNNSDLETLQRTFESSFPSRKHIANIYRAICNYYQLPIGSGTDCQFDFDYEALCNTYRFDVVEFFNATRFLEKEGLISLPDPDESQSRIHIPLDREEVYRFQVNQPRYSDLMSLLLRMYGGIFTDFVPISEQALARRLYYDPQQIKNMLLHMDALKAIIYRPKHTKPQIVFPSPRIDANDLYLSESTYAEIKQRAEERLEAIRHYILSDNCCRSQILLSYFGENDSAPCGICDYCLKHKKSDKTNSTEKTTALQEQILQLLKERPCRAEELIERVGDIEEEPVLNMLRELVDQHLVTITDTFQFKA
ncbi:MAG: RecQ family ATP-dependent DNA helicase, partial [Bacteroidales bacterium]|nr:RecQ family ATP-dependent DNA helicase [Bacteroidales bacterium]